MKEENFTEYMIAHLDELVEVFIDVEQKILENNDLRSYDEKKFLLLMRLIVEMRCAVEDDAVQKTNSHCRTTVDRDHIHSWAIETERDEIEKQKRINSYFRGSANEN